MTSSLRAGFKAAGREPAFALYLTALAGLGFKWLSPLSSFYSNAIWSDLFLAAAAIVWLIARVRHGGIPKVRAFHIGLALYMAAGALSLAFASDQALGAKTVLVMLELAVLAFLTSEFASESDRLSAIVWVIVFLSLYTAVLGVVGLGLFYGGVDTSLLGVYGKLTPSQRYSRIAAGFESGPLLSSFCIFASAVIARRDVTLPARLRFMTQVALGGLVLFTFSRGIIGFAAALAIRGCYRRRDSRRVRIATAVFVAASVGLIVALSAGRLHLDPTEPASAHYVFPNPDGRRENAATSLDTFAHHPVVGIGPGGLPGRHGDYRAHLTPLNIAATMGLPALAAMTFLIVTLWRNRRRPTPIATWSGLAGLAIDGLTQDIDHFRHVWVMIGLADADRRPDANDPHGPRGVPHGVRYGDGDGSG